MAPLTRKRRAAALVAAAVALLVGGTASEARVTRITISKVTSPQFNGQSFGNVGTYEELRGTFTGEIDPNDRRNTVITDINLAPTNARGKVEYTATFTLLKPVDMGKASGVLVYGASGWQGDMVFEPNNPAETIRVPVAKDVTSPTFARFVTVQGNVNTQ